MRKPSCSLKFEDVLFFLGVMFFLGCRWFLCFFWFAVVVVERCLCMSLSSLFLQQEWFITWVFSTWRIGQREPMIEYLRHLTCDVAVKADVQRHLHHVYLHCHCAL